MTNGRGKFMSESERLNCFACFENKADHHEDPLTRAFLLVLRLVPDAHSVFLKIIRKHRSYTRPKLPNTKGAIFETQKAKVSSPAKRLLSILITGQRYTEEHRVRKSRRKQVLDGIISYPPNWVFVIENKPEKKHVWRGQLNPNSEINIIEPKLIRLEWREVIAAISGLLKTRRLNPTEQQIVQDFQEYVVQNFEGLNPYDTIEMCRGKAILLEFRCAEIMKQIVGHDCVSYHHGWSTFMSFDGAAQQIALRPSEENNGEWELELGLAAGDTVEQAKALYEKLNIKKLLALRHLGWQIKPNFHFGFRQQQLQPYPKNRMSLEKYLRFWMKHAELIRQVPTMSKRNRKLKKHESRKYLKILRSTGLLKEYDKESERVAFFSRRRAVNLRPGINVWYNWSSSVAAKLDLDGGLVADVHRKIKDVFSTWEQKFEPMSMSS